MKEMCSPAKHSNMSVKTGLLRIGQVAYSEESHGWLGMWFVNASVGKVPRSQTYQKYHIFISNIKIKKNANKMHNM